MSEVTVVIPTYNRATLAERAVSMALEQWGVVSDVIMVDDGSSDHTLALLTERFGDNPRVQVRHQTNAGVSAARNHGMRLPRGEFIAFLDSDDHWEPWKLKVQLRVLRRLHSERVGFNWTNLNAIDDSGKVLRPRCLRALFGAYAHMKNFGEPVFQQESSLEALGIAESTVPSSTVVGWGDVFTGMAVGNLCQPSSLTVRRELIEQTQGFDENLRYGEDHRFHIQLAKLASGSILDTPATGYRVGAGDQLTGNKHMVEIAQAFLETFANVIATDGSRIRLSDEQLHDILVGAHRWVIDASLRQGQATVAKEYLRRLVSLHGMEARFVVPYAVSSIGDRPLAVILHLYRRLKTMMRPAVVKGGEA